MKMTRKVTGKIAALVAVALVSVAVMAVALTGMQNTLSRSGYTDEIAAEQEALPGLLEAAASETVENTEQYDAIYQSKAAQVAYAAQNGTGFEATDAQMVAYQELLGVDNVLVVNRAGDVIAAAQPTKAQFSYARFNQLRQTFDTHEPSQAVEIEVPEEEWLDRYYACRIDDDTMVVIEQNPAELRELVAQSGSVASVLANITLGQTGFVFAVSAQDYLITYHPDENLVGADAIDAGISVADLEDGAYATMNVAGQELYCGVTLIDGTYYLCAVPEASMVSSTAITVGVILFVFVVVVAAVTLYGIFVLRSEGHDGATGAGDGAAKKPQGTLRLNRRIAPRAAVLCGVGFLAVLVISFYMQTLFALSSQSLLMNERVLDIADTIERTEAAADDLTTQYNERYLSKAEVAAYIIERNPELANRQKLQELADALEVQSVFVFDAAGTMTTTNSSYTNFTLSEDPQDQSYEFRKLLQGVESLVQEPQPDEISGEFRQYIGVTTHDGTGELTGFVQLGIRSDRLESMLQSVQIDHVLDGVKVGAAGFAFAINKDDGTFAYYPDANTIGKKAADCGLTEDQLRDGFSDYITVNGTTYYASATETADYYIFVAGSEGALMGDRIPMTLTTGAIAFVCLAVIFGLMVWDTAQTGAAPEAARARGGESRRMIEVSVDDRRVRTESAATRWLSRSLHWDEMTPEQKLGFVLKCFVGLGAILVAIAVIGKDAIFEPGTLFAYILGGGWAHGLNIFAITASIMFACVLLTVVTIVQKVLSLVGRVLDARGLTICRLVSSVAKYGSMIGMLYWCLALLGVDTATLLASAGLLTFAVSLGAKDIVTDIISGLFIIFEGEFRVGDIIQVGGNKGTVIEIGVRSTKINDGSGNILVLRNSSVSNVVNMTKETSYAAVEVGIEYGESLERVEAILSRELPEMKKRLPAIIDGPFYRGISMLADNAVNIKIVAECAESNRGGLTSDLMREMKLLFDKYDISIPYPQVVVNQPIEFKKATLADKAAAREFNAEQKEAIKNMTDENEDFDEFNDTRRH